MAKPPGDGRILNTNKSTYNLIAHDVYVPPSPPFGPSPRQIYGDSQKDYEAARGGGQGREYIHERREQEREDPRTAREKENARWWQPAYQATNAYGSADGAISSHQHIPDSPLYRPGQTNGVVRFDGQTNGHQGDRGDDRMGRDNWGMTRFVDGVRVSQNYKDVKGHGSLSTTIGNVNHIPVSPLYRPGLGQPMVDPRQDSSQGRKQVEFQEVQKPKHPPTPDYNTTQINIPNDNNEDTKLNLGGLRENQEDLRDYRANKAPWAGYQDRPTYRGPPNTDRPWYRGDRSYREGPWTWRENGPSFVSDPRVGGHHDGVGHAGNKNGGALLFIRFPVGQGDMHSAAQTFLKSKTHDVGGRFLGMAKRVFDFGYERGLTEGIGVFHFPSIEKGCLFFQMDPLLRQPDFPSPYGHAEIWLVNNAYLPDNLELFSTFLLSEIELHPGKEKREFFETFQKPFENYLFKNGAMPFVICSYAEHDRKSLRRHMYSPTSIVTCHLFQGLDHLNWITNDETYCKFRSLHNQLATDKCSIFNLNREIFP